MIKVENSILVVLAHPDDEFATAGLLLRAHYRGMKTHLICATRGEAGRINNFTDLSTCEKKRIRTKELEQSSKVLNLTSLDFLELGDSKGDSWHSDDSVNKLTSIIKEKNPDIVITFDSNGYNGHPDHIAISNITLEAVKNLYTKEDKKLYYLTPLPRSLVEGAIVKFPLHEELKSRILKYYTTEDDKVTSVLKLEEKEISIKLELLNIYKSQFPDSNGNYYRMPYKLIEKLAAFESYSLIEPIYMLERRTIDEE